jgi:hypothetical protein
VNWLELPQMQKPEHLIEIAAGEDHTHSELCLTPLSLTALRSRRYPRESSSAAPTICIRRSGEALSRNHFAWLLLPRDTVCADRSSAFPARISLQFRQAHFHCGNPPPAAVPRILICASQNYSVAAA